MSSPYPWLFVVEYYDPLPRIKRQYLLRYWGVDEKTVGGNGFVEMVDLKSKKLFLKKSPAPFELDPRNLVIGARILLYSRELDIVDYGDGNTRRQLQHATQSTIVILSPEVFSNWGKIIDTLLNSDFQDMIISHIKTVIFSPNLADTICATLDENIRNTSSLSSGLSCVLLLSGENGIQRAADKVTAMNEGRVMGGAIYCSINGQQVASLAEILLNPKVNNSSTLDSCTCCIVKPHAVKMNDFGKILDVIISQGYDVSAIQSINFTKVQAEEFYEVYKGVIPDYSDHVVQLCSGLSIALELRAEDAVPTFRLTAGPWDVEMAKELRPESLRAKFGVDKVRSAIHCTDLPVDAVAECEYVFRILSS